MFTKVKSLGHKLAAYLTVMVFCLLASVPVLADETAADADVAKQVLEQFTTAAASVKTLILGIIGICLSVTIVKVIYKAGVSFFKSGVSK